MALNKECSIWLKLEMETLAKPTYSTFTKGKIRSGQLIATAVCLDNVFVIMCNHDVHVSLFSHHQPNLTHNFSLDWPTTKTIHHDFSLGHRLVFIITFKYHQFAS